MRQATWHGLELALAQGLTRAIGVSNFKKADLQDILLESTTKPAVNQWQVHTQSAAACDVSVDFDRLLVVPARCTSEGTTMRPSRSARRREFTVSTQAIFPEYTRIEP